VEELRRALLGGEVHALLAMGPGLVGPVDDEPPPLAADVLGRARALIVLDAHSSPLSTAATVLLPAAGYAETSGAYVNFAGRVQHAEKCLTPKVDCRPAAMILGDLFAGLGGGELPPPSRIREHLSRDAPALAAIRWDETPASPGQNLAGVDAAAEAPPATGALVQMLAAGVNPAGG
jgi:predicted molibdopterin-dependent oxidoreductase YjgC